MEKLRNSSAYSVFKNFEKLSQIPRCSNSEEEISEFMYQFGLSLGLETKKDHVGNVIITKPASAGYEDKETIALQSHLDMVCVKTEDSTHDFTCDPIEIIIDGDTIHANNTTLGADDGIGAALTMAILEDKEAKHPKLEALFTTTEETGMDGALGLSADALTAKNMINLDNEEDWMIIVGCAGGEEASISREITRKTIVGLKNFAIKIKGLRGGHSGTMICEPRVNAVKLLISILQKIKAEIPFQLVSIDGGIKHNAIPSDAKAVFAVKEESVEKLEEIFNCQYEEAKEKYLKRETDMTIELVEVAEELSYIAEDEVKEILRALQVFPHGVNAMDKELNIVRSSNNLAIVSTEENTFNIITSIRSSQPGEMQDLRDKVSEVANSNNFTANFADGYPMWSPSFDNPLLNLAEKTYEELKGEKPEIAVIHAGLECGIIKGKYPEMNIISCGPTILGAHTPRERLSVKSTEFSYNYIREIIKNL